MADPRPLTREELTKFLPNHRAVRAFEELFRRIPADIISNEEYIEVVNILAEGANAKAQQAIDALERISNSLDTLSLAPRFVQDDNQVIDALSKEPKFVQNDNKMKYLRMMQWLSMSS